MNAKRQKTDTPVQATAEVTAAHRRIFLSTAKEDRWKCGLEYIGRRLDDARACAEAAAARILPDVADVKLNPAPTLASLCATPPEWQPAVKLSELCELIFAQLQKEAVLKPDVELLYHGNKRLETFASDWFVFLFGWRDNGGCLAFMRKKIALAQTLGKQGAADKLTEAVRQLPPTFPLTDFGDNDAARLADEITPDGFHVAFRNAMKLDAEATAEINGEEKNTGTRDAVMVANSLKRLEKGQGALLDGQSRQNDYLISLGQVADEINRNTQPDTPRPDDYEVTQEDAAQILTVAGYKVSARQIQNWERFINTGGKGGTPPPDGYRIGLRAQFLPFKAWAENAAKDKRMKHALRERRQRAHKTNA